MIRSIPVRDSYEAGVPYINEFARCERSYRGSGIYVLKFDNGIKIGMAKNICNRVKHYESPWIREVQQQAFYKTRNPLALELFLKRHFKRSIVTHNSSEFLVGNTFEYVVRFIENNRFFKSSTGANNE